MNNLEYDPALGPPFQNYSVLGNQCSPSDIAYRGTRTEYDNVQFLGYLKRLENSQYAEPYKLMPSQGLSFNPNDPTYKPIGGMPGGVTWN